jgi:hypothetical protein
VSMKTLGSVVRTLGCLAAGVAALMMPMSSVEARSVGAFSGNPLDGSSSLCFAESAGAVTGTGATVGGVACVGHPYSDSPRWEVNLPIDASGNWTVTVGIRGNGTSGPSCITYAYNQTSGYVTASGAVTNTTTSFVTKSMTVSSVPSGGFIFMACDNLDDTSSAIGSVNWNQ